MIRVYIFIYTLRYRIRYNGTIAKDCSKGGKVRKKFRTTDPTGIERCVGARNRKKRFAVHSCEPPNKPNNYVYAYIYIVMSCIYIYQSISTSFFFLSLKNTILYVNNNIIHSIFWWWTFRNLKYNYIITHTIIWLDCIQVCRQKDIQNCYGNIKKNCNGTIFCDVVVRSFSKSMRDLNAEHIIL